MKNPYDQSPPSRPVREIADEPATPEMPVTTLADGSPIPSTWPELVKLLPELSAAPLPTDKDELALHKARIKEAGRRAHAVQQASPPAPEATANEQMQATIFRRTKFTRRVARCETLREFLNRSTPEAKPAPAFDLKSDARARLLIEPEILNRVWKCRQLLAKAELFELENYDFVCPKDRLIEIAHEVVKAKDLQALRGLAAESVTLTHVVANGDFNTIAKHAVEKARQPAVEAIAELLEFTRSLFQSWETEAKEREDKFCKAQGVPSVRTALSQRFAEAIKSLPSASRELGYFGIKDIAACD